MLDFSALTEPGVYVITNVFTASQYAWNDANVWNSRTVSRAMGLWQRLEADPGQLASLAAQLAGTAERLTMIWTPHLSLEEATIFPAARTTLSPEQLAQLHQEMRERRAKA